MKPILEVAAKLGIPSDLVVPYGREFVKVDPKLFEQPRKRDEKPKMILVSAMTPTPAGEGKTTTTIGLGDAFSQLGESVCIALREPSLGPCMGIKGGGTGGGRSQLIPSDRINLHFTGDFHAITAAHNLLAATIDNHLHFETELELEPRRVLWRRVLDMNDRALRNVVIGLGGKTHGQPRESGFDITAASEIMAILCLSENLQDLRTRLDRTLVAFKKDGAPVTAKELGVTGAMVALLRDTLMPNLVQTMEGTPALVHGGPFANIAHGCNSVIATKAALHLADWTITEAGFGFDLGAEKFYDIKCRSAGLDTAAVVLVASVRALKMHGGVKLNALSNPDTAAVEAGLPNLAKHIENVGHFGAPPVVALNRRDTDTDEEIEIVRKFCDAMGAPFAVADHFARGGEGAVDLAKKVISAAGESSRPSQPLYPLDVSVPEKIFAVASKMYGARNVVYTKSAERDLRQVERLGFGRLPVCIAKTPSSLSDDPSLGGRPDDFDVTVRNIQINSGAGFLVVLTGEVLRMPGLPRTPAAENIDLEGDQITGLR